MLAVNVVNNLSCTLFRENSRKGQKGRCNMDVEKFSHLTEEVFQNSGPTKLNADPKTLMNQRCTAKSYSF